MCGAVGRGLNPLCVVGTGGFRAGGSESVVFGNRFLYEDVPRTSRPFCLTMYVNAQMLQKMGKVDDSKDESFERYVANFNAQHVSSVPYLVFAVDWLVSLSVKMARLLQWTVCVLVSMCLGVVY